MDPASQWKMSFGEAINCIQFGDEGRNKFLFSEVWRKGKKPLDNFCSIFFMWNFLWNILFVLFIWIHKIIICLHFRLPFYVSAGYENNHSCLCWRVLHLAWNVFESDETFWKDTFIRHDLAHAHTRTKHPPPLHVSHHCIILNELSKRLRLSRLSAAEVWENESACEVVSAMMKGSVW